jgi:hypothetical protein
MPDKCVAPKCTTNAENRVLPKEKRINVFRFPEDKKETKEIRQRWINAVPIENFEPSKYSALCLKHFVGRDSVKI